MNNIKSYLSIQESKKTGNFFGLLVIEDKETNQREFSFLAKLTLKELRMFEEGNKYEGEFGLYKDSKEEESVLGLKLSHEDENFVIPIFETEKSKEEKIAAIDKLDLKSNIQEIEIIDTRKYFKIILIK